MATFISKFSYHKDLFDKKELEQLYNINESLRISEKIETKTMTRGEKNLFEMDNLIKYSLSYHNRKI